MTDITIPVPAELMGNTDSAAPQVTTQNIPAEQIANTPQAETPDGNPQAAKPDGDEQKKTNEEKQERATANAGNSTSRPKRFCLSSLLFCSVKWRG